MTHIEMNISIGYGNELLEFFAGDELCIPDALIPLTFTIVLTKYQDQYLFVYNPERQQWEAPGGGINPGELTYDCACREVLEETSQAIDKLTYKGLFKVRLEGQLEYGALYIGEILQLKPFIPNEEAERITLCHVTDKLEGNISILTNSLIGFAALQL